MTQTLSDRINDDLKTAMREKAEFRLGVIRMIRSELLLNQKSDKALPEVEIVQAYQKKLVKSLELYKDAPDAADKIKKEIEIINTYLPQKPTKEDIQNRIKKHLGLGNMGAIMKTLKAEVEAEGKMFDGREASEMIKTMLG